MGSEFFTDEKKWVSSRRAAEISGYAPDYIGQLCRKGLLECRLIGRGWFVTETSLLEHKNTARAKPSKNIEKSNKILIQKAEPRVIEPSPIISNVPDTWDVFLFSSASEENKNIEPAHSKNFKDAPAYTQNIGAIYPDAVESVLHKKNIFFNFSEYLYLFSTKAFIPLILLIALGVGGFYIKDNTSNVFATLFNSKQIIFETGVKNIPISSTLSSRLEHLVNTLQSPFDKEIVYQNGNILVDIRPVKDVPETTKHNSSENKLENKAAVVDFNTLSLLPLVRQAQGLLDTFINEYVYTAAGAVKQRVISLFTKTETTTQIDSLATQSEEKESLTFFETLEQAGVRVYQAINTLVLNAKRSAFSLVTQEKKQAEEKEKEEKIKIVQRYTNILENISMLWVDNIYGRIAHNTKTGIQCIVESVFGENPCLSHLKMPPVVATDISTTDITSNKTKVAETIILADDEIKRALLRDELAQLKSQGIAAVAPAIEQTVVERVIERVVAGITPEDVAVQLNALENKLRQEIFKVGESGTREVRVVERQVALTNKIDQLPGVTLINATVSGTFDGLTDAHIPNDITATNYLEIAGGNITGTLGVGTSTPTEDFAVANRIYIGGAGTSTIENNLSVLGSIAIGSVCINCDSSGTFSGGGISASATSTFSGGPLTATYVPPNAHLFSAWEIGVSGSQVTNASLVINPASADSDTNLLGIAVNGSARFLIDAEGDVFANSLTSVGGETLSTTSISTLTVENSSTFGDATTTDRTYFNSRIGSSLIPTANNLLDIGDTTNALAWRTGIFGTSIGIGTTSPYAPLSVVGEAVAEYFSATSVTATSTIAGFLDVTGTNSTSTFSGGLSTDAFAVTGSATSTFNAGISLSDGNINLATGGAFLINNDFVLSATTLGSSVANSSLASVGALDSGSITSNFGTINIGTSALTAGAGAFTTLSASSLASLSGGFISSASSSVTTLQGTDLFASSTIVSPIFLALDTTATSTFSGFLDVTGTNSTSTFSGGLAAGTVNVTGSATSTFANGITIADGCFAINGTCVGGGGGGMSIGGAVTSGTANSVLFVDSSGNLAQNNANFFWDDSLTNLYALSASTSRLSVFDIAYFGGTATSTFDSSGILTLTSALGIGSGGTATTTFYNSGVLFYNDTLGTLSQASAQSGLVFDNTNSRLGVGTSSPSKRLSVSEEVSDAQVAIAYDDTRYAHLQVDSAGDLIVSSQGGDVRLNNENLFVCAGGACPTGTPSAQGSIIAETEIGIGTSSPTAQLGVANNIFIGGGGAPALGTATSTFAGDIIILGKLDVGTIDPAYTIGGTTYATYGHSTVGIKEEVAVKINVAVFNKQSGYYEYRIDFDDLLSGSDLWLFYQITNFGEQWENLVVTLTPAFDGRVFYTEDRKNNRLIVSSTVSGAVSVRLIAPRFDSEKWGNIRPDQNGWKGFILNLKK